MKEKNIKKKKEKKTRDKRQRIFNIIYAVLTLFLIVVAIIDKTSNHNPSTEILFALLIFSLLEISLILMFINNIVLFKNKKKRILSFLAFIGNGIIYSLSIFIDYNLVSLIFFIYNTIFISYLLIDFLLHKTKHPTSKFFDKKLIYVVLIISVMLLSNYFDHTYLDANIILLYALIPMGVVMAIFAILSFTLFKKTYEVLAKKIGYKILISIMALILSFGYGMIFIDVANTSIKTNPEIMECVIVDKNVRSGYRQITRYELYVLINNKKITINVSSDVYKSKEIDDTLTVNYYKGGLNLAFYESGE